ncbi:hypothetical protein EDD85DRAFT_797366 [Armillaria nabsnona]|nr:hypothetical protein EDD85DRAFT_797366 [Armillaria nabsnona]
MPRDTELDMAQDTEIEGREDTEGVRESSEFSPRDEKYPQHGDYERGRRIRRSAQRRDKVGGTDVVDDPGLSFRVFGKLGLDLAHWSTGFFVSIMRGGGKEGAEYRRPARRGSLLIRKRRSAMGERVGGFPNRLQCECRAATGRGVDNITAKEICRMTYLHAPRPAGMQEIPGKISIDSRWDITSRTRGALKLFDAVYEDFQLGDPPFSWTDTVRVLVASDPSPDMHDDLPTTGWDETNGLYAISAMVHTARREHTLMECTRLGLGAATPFESDHAGPLQTIVVAKECHIEKHATSKNRCRYSFLEAEDRLHSLLLETSAILVWLSVLNSDFHLIGALPPIFVFDHPAFVHGTKRDEGSVSRNRLSLMLTRVKINRHHDSGGQYIRRRQQIRDYDRYPTDMAAFQNQSGTVITFGVLPGI